MSLKCGIVGLAQRRQVDALQRADQGGHRGRELSVLHHRAQRRHRRVPDPRLARARRDRASGTRAAGDRRVRRHRRVWSPGASKGEGLGNQFLANIRETDAIAHVVALLRGRQRRARRGQDRSGLRHRDDQHRAGARRPRHRWTSSSRSIRKGRARRRRQGGAAARRGRSRKSRPRSNEAQAGALRRSLRRGARGAAAVLPADDEADDVRRQRRASTASTTIRCSLRVEMRTRAKARRSSPIMRGARSARSPTSTATTS